MISQKFEANIFNFQKVRFAGGCMDCKFRRIRKETFRTKTIYVDA
jgi:hypothetical protein